MIRRLTLAFALCALAVSSAAGASLRLERVVLVERHGVRPPTQTNAELAKYADKPWPDWPVAPGVLTPHGAATVRLMGETLHATYRAAGLLPAHRCAGAGAVSVWADGTDERTRHSGQILADTLAPGCGVKAGFAAPSPRDPIFDDSANTHCRVDPDKAREALAAAAAGPAGSTPVAEALTRLQAIVAPDACKGGAGTCLAATPTIPAGGGMASYGAAPSLAEDLLLEYADGKPLKDVGWGRASAADIAAVMPVHERTFAILRDAAYVASHRSAYMGRVVLAALQGEPAAGGPRSGPRLRVLALAGHDTNLALMAGIFGLSWTLPGEPDGTAPSTVLAFEVWSDGDKRFVRPVIYYETLEQLRTLRPGRAARLPLTFADCTRGPTGECALDDVIRHANAVIPPECQTPEATEN
jgi:4-phytase/acid phosphatase